MSGTIALSGGMDPLTQVQVVLIRNGQIIATTTPAAGSGAYSANVPSGTGYTVEAFLAGYTTQTSAAFDVSAAPVGGKNLTLPLASPSVWIDITGGTQNTPYASLDQAYAWLQSNFQSNTEYTIRVGADQYKGRFGLLNSVKTNVRVILRANTSPVVITNNPYGDWEVGETHTLILDSGITLRGRSDRNGPMVDVRGNGHFIMKNGSTITGNTYINAPGVNVWQNGTFTMNGGTISNNKNTGSYTGGGGVYVITNGSFNMTGGTITGNSASTGGGVFFASTGTFNMSGSAVISNNTATNGHGGGVLISDSAVFTMNGGTISNNKAPGSYSGGGVYVNTNGVFNMTGGTITGNSAGDSGGVAAYDGTFKMSGNAFISKNNSTTLSGGGVGIFGPQSVFSKTGGTIYGDNGGADKNTAGDGYGHAVYAANTHGPSTDFWKRRNNTAGPSDKMSFNGAAKTASGF